MVKKVHFVHLGAGPGGIEVLLPLIIKNIKNKPISVFVLRSKPDGVNVYDKTGISVNYGHNRNIIAFFKFYFYAVRNKKDIFHVFNIGPAFLLLLKLGGVKRIIYSLHGTIYWKSKYKKIILCFLWQRALSNRIVFIANSNYSKNEFLRKIDAGVQIRVVYNPIDENRFTLPLNKIDKNEILIIYAGRLVNGKNLLYWIEIAIDLHAKIPLTRFALYGDGSLKETLQNKIIQAHAEGYIQLKPFKGDIEKVYQEADLFLFLSEYESFGNVVVESIFCGTPVISYSIPSMQEIFYNYPVFLLNENEQVKEQIYSKIENLNELKKQTEIARRDFLQRFCLEQHINSLQEVYDAIE